MHTKLHSCAQGYATGPPTDISTGAGKRPPRRPDAISERRGDGKGSPRSKAMRTAGGGRGLPICVANATGRRPRRNRPRPRRHSRRQSSLLCVTPKTYRSFSPSFSTAFSTVVVATMLSTRDLTAFLPQKTGLTADFTPCFCDRKNIPHQSKRKTGRTFQRLLQNPSGHFARAESRIQESDCDEFRAVGFFAPSGLKKNDKDSDFWLLTPVRGDSVDAHARVSKKQ